MRALILILLLLPWPALAESHNVILTWESDPSWQTAAGGTYLPLEIAGVTAPRRLAVRILADRQVVGEVWDDPAGRSVTVSVPTDTNTAPHISAQAVAYEGSPWQASHAYSLGDRVSTGGFPSDRYSWVVTTAGTSAATEPEWHAGKGLADSSAVDNGDGTVDLPCPAHGFVAGQDVTISGTTNYDGTYTLGTQTDPDWLTLTATYVAEAMIGATVRALTVTDGTVGWTWTDQVARPLTGPAASSAWGGADLPCPGHNFERWQVVTISGTTNYNGEYTIHHVEPGVITIGATYVAETFAAGAQAAGAAGMNVLTSEPTRRIVGQVRAEDGRIISGGMKFRVRQQ